MRIFFLFISYNSSLFYQFYPLFFKFQLILFQFHYYLALVEKCLQLYLVFCSCCCCYNWANHKTFKVLTSFLLWSSIIFVCLSEDFPTGEHKTLPCSIIWIWLEGKIYFKILYCSLSSLILSSIVKITFNILFKRLRLRCNGLYDARVGSLARKEYDFALRFCNIYKVFKVHIWWMINSSLVNFFLFLNFRIK